MLNPLLLTDSYKHSHWAQYPPGTTEVYSGITARTPLLTVVPFGLQAALHYIQDDFIGIMEILQAEEILSRHFGRSDVFHKTGWLKLVEAHQGALPVEIRAVPEGTPVMSQNVLLTIRNTDPNFPWLPSWLETMLVQTWYPTTIATMGRTIKQDIAFFLDKTSDSLESLLYKLHDFGFRGVSSTESAAVGGAAHLVNFRGTDTLIALQWLEAHYRTIDAGHSIPAMEHSTVTAWGRDSEGDAFANMLDKFPTGLIACVVDSYDAEYACKVLMGSKLKSRILSRQGTLVVRPDSGPPVDSVLAVMKTLGDAFGTVKNSKGYKLLPPQLRLIQGDGVNPSSIYAILSALEATGWSTENIAFGMGGALLQDHTRDELGFAMKCSAAVVDGGERGVFKAPVGDPTKHSTPGRKALIRLESGVWQTVAADSLPGRTQDQLRTVFLNGKLIGETTLTEVRWRARIAQEKDELVTHG